MGFMSKQIHGEQQCKGSREAVRVGLETVVAALTPMESTSMHQYWIMDRSILAMVVYSPVDGPVQNATFTPSCLDGMALCVS